MEFLFVQFLTGLAGASSLFLVSAGLTVIFGVTRVVNFAHGSLYMLGAYLGWTILAFMPRTPGGLAAGFALAALAVALIGVALESGLLRRLYRAPELLQLLATFAVMLVVQEAVLRIWGPADLPLPRPRWLRATLAIGEARFPIYDLVLIATGPVVLLALWLIFARTRWGILIRAATADRDMVAALGVDQRLLFTSVFALGAGLAGLAGAMALPDISASLSLDLSIIVEAFVVVVLGGMGSLGGAALASLLIGLTRAFGVVIWPEGTLVIVFALMALVLALRPHGLLGRKIAAHTAPTAAPVLRPASPALRLLAAAALLAALAAPFLLGAFGLAVLTEAAIAILFAASLHFLMGPGGMASFGHAAWFGLGAYAAGLLAQRTGLPMLPALLAATIITGIIAAIFALSVVRLSGIYLAMLTLALAQILWAAAVQWTALTGGENGILGVWPPSWADARVFYFLSVALCIGATLLLRRAIFSPFGYALRAARDAEARAEASGIPAARLRIACIAISGAAAGLSGALFAFAKGSVFPSYAAIARSVDALLMVLLGGVQTVSGPILGALGWTALYDVLLRATEWWRLLLGLTILALVMAFPDGIGGIATRFQREAAP